jgi:formate hydrogenlyase transcriptional activator
MQHDSSLGTDQIDLDEHIEKRHGFKPEPTAFSDLMREKDMLLETTIGVSGIRNKHSLLMLFTNILNKHIPFDGFVLYLLDRSSRHAVCYLAYSDSTEILPQATSLAYDINLHFRKEAIVTEILSAQQAISWQATDIRSRNNIQEMALIEKLGKVRKLAGVPLLTGENSIGAILLLSRDPNAYNAESLCRINSLTPHIAVAVRNVLSAEKDSRTAIDLTLLTSLFTRLAGARTRVQFEHALSQELAQHHFFEEAALFLKNSDNLPPKPLIIRQTHRKMFVLEPSSTCREDQDPITAVWAHFEGLTEATPLDLRTLLVAGNRTGYLKRWTERQMAKLIAAPIRHNNQLRGLLIFLTNDPKRELFPYIHLVNGIANYLSVLSIPPEIHREMTSRSSKINDQQQQFSHGDADIIGVSDRIQNVFHLVSQVATADTSVLILGETGTGKELVARAIHNNSPRKNNVMIKVNCGALPFHLIESELFGHERGSFTDATDQRIGKFELANNSTIFLDEIGELPLAAQAKLLRALQEKEIERLGGKGVIKINVRVIAATNSDLQRAVQQGLFRSDLYFRLNVFPIDIPPLRERKEDIPALASHFLKKHATSALPSKIRFTANAMKQLKAYHWPGNVRELEHLVERTILSAKNMDINTVHLPERNIPGPSRSSPHTHVKTLDEVHREHIMRVLSMVDGKVSGVGGAAALLKIPASTLFSKMQKLKIHKDICAPPQLK